MTASHSFFMMTFTILFIYFNLFIYWRIIALQNFVVFYQTSTWISHRYTYIPSFWISLPSPSPSHPSRLIQNPCFLSHTANSRWLSILYMVMLLSMSFLTSHPLPISISLFSMSLSPLLPCKLILQYHFSIFHICALAYDIYLSLSDSLHSKIIYDPPPRVMEIKTKVNKLDLIKLKSFCTAKETISDVKRQPSEWEKIIAI